MFLKNRNIISKMKRSKVTDYAALRRLIFKVIFICLVLQSSRLLSCQPRATETSCFAYKVIRDLESIDHLFINPIHRIGLITSDVSICISSSDVYKLMFS